MEALKQILMAHSRRYPGMEPQDAVKLIYQNEFGGGHLIQSEAGCTDYLLREYASVAQSSDIPLTEEIGNGLVRVHLAALEAHGYPPEDLAADFIRSAAMQTGSMDSFLAKLTLLHRCAEYGIFSFSPECLDAYLREYAARGYPMVSHSELYRSSFHPAYRIVKKSLIHRKFTAES